MFEYSYINIQKYNIKNISMECIVKKKHDNLIFIYYNNTSMAK